MDQTMEEQLADEELSALLATSDLTESYGTGPVPVGFLDTSCSRGGLASCLGGELLAWGLASGGLAGSLLGTSHGELVNFRRFWGFFIVPATCTRLLIGESRRPIVEGKNRECPQVSYIKVQRSTAIIYHIRNNDRQRQRRKGARKGRRQAPQEGVA